MSEKPQIQEIQIIYHATTRWPLSVIFIIIFQFQTQKCTLRGSQTSWSPRTSFLASRPLEVEFFGIFFFVGHFNGNPHCLPVPELFQLQLWTFPTTLVLMASSKSIGYFFHHFQLPWNAVNRKCLSFFLGCCSLTKKDRPVQYSESQATPGGYL